MIRGLASTKHGGRPPCEQQGLESASTSSTSSGHHGRRAAKAVAGRAPLASFSVLPASDGDEQGRMTRTSDESSMRAPSP
ncbi:hypothetical protein Dimus_027058 [Dionaea muscipula]